MFIPKRMYDCCVCGCGYRMTDLQKMDIKRVDNKLMRHINTNLCEQHLCRNCRRKCSVCFIIIPKIQYNTYERCNICVTEARVKRRKL